MASEAPPRATRPTRIVAVDIDEVLGHFVPQLCAFHNATYGSNFQLSDFHSYNFWECGLGRDRDDTTRICFEFFASEYFARMPVLPGAAVALAAMRATHNVELVVVTSRQLDIEAATKTWLEEHYAGLLTTVRFGHHYGRAGDDRKPKSKAEICADLGATVLIDDSLIYALQCAKTLEHVLLFDYQGSYPWNKVRPAPVGDGSAATAEAAALPANVHRVHSWEEALQVFAKLHASDASP